MVTTALPFLLSIYLLFHFQKDGGYQFVEQFEWIKNFGVSYYLGLDGLNVSLVLLVSLLSFLVVLTIKHWDYRAKAFFSCLLIMEAGLLGVFLSLDLILFYIFWEIVLIPGYFLISIWGGSEQRERVGLRFLIYTLFGSLIMLIAILAIYFKADLHTFSIPALTSVNLPLDFQKFIFFFLFIGLAIKVPLFPFHSWQPDAYVEAPNPVTVLFSGLVAKMGVYGFLRLGYCLVPEGSAHFSTIICIMAIITILYANLCAAAQTDLKRMFAYSSLGHMGLIVLGISVLNNLGVSGAIFHMFTHGLIAGATFLAIGLIQETMGTIEIGKLRMIIHIIPTGAMLLWLVLLASFGLPGMGSFIAELYILSGAFQAKIIYGLLAMVGTIIMAGYIFSLLPRISFRGAIDEQTPSPEKYDLSPRKYNYRVVASLFFLMMIIIALGLYPKLLMLPSKTYTQEFLARINNCATVAER